MEAILNLKPQENTKDLKSFLGAIQYLANFLPILSEQTDRLKKLLKKNEPWKCGPEQETDFNRTKQMLTEGPCLAHYAKVKDNMVTTDASKTGLGIYFQWMCFMVSSESGRSKFTSRFTTY